MTGYTDLTKLESSRNCLRRIARHDEQQFSKDSIVNVMEKFVKTVNIMDETILVPCRLMDSQVGDATDIIQAPAKTSASHFALNGAGSNNKNRKKTVHEVLSSADLFNLYNMLNSLKNDLLWTRNEAVDETEDEGLASAPATPTVEIDANLEQNINLESNQNTTSSTATTTVNSKGHNRRPSTASMASTNSVSNLSDSESDISNENDSGIESEGHCGNSQNGGNSCSKSANFDKATDLAKQCRQHLSGLYRCLEQMTDAANYLTARYQNDIGQA